MKQKIKFAVICLLAQFLFLYCKSNINIDIGKKKKSASASLPTPTPTIASLTPTATPTPTPTPIPEYPVVSSSRLWLDYHKNVYTDYAATIPAVPGDLIRAFKAVGAGWGNDLMISVTDAQRPTLRSDGIQSDGVDDAMTFDTGYSMTFPGDLTVYFVGTAGPTDNIAIACDTRNNGYWGFSLIIEFSGGARVAMGHDTAPGWGNAGRVDNGYRIWRIRRTSGITYFNDAGIEKLIDANSGSQHAGNFYLNSIMNRYWALFSVWDIPMANTARYNQFVVIEKAITPGDSDDLAIIAKLRELEPGVLGP